MEFQSDFFEKGRGGKLSLEKESFPRAPFKEIIWDFKGWGFFRGPSGRMMLGGFLCV